LIPPVLELVTFEILCARLQSQIYPSEVLVVTLPAIAGRLLEFFFFDVLIVYRYAKFRNQYIVLEPGAFVLGSAIGFMGPS
jgi:hypothetical protein